MCIDIYNLKAELLFFNSLCLVGGLIKLTACIANLKYAENLSNYLLFFALRIMAGGSVFFIALYGYYAAFTENVRRMWHYVVLQFLFVFFDLALMTFRFCHQTEFKSSYAERIFLAESLRYIEEEYKCCGRSGTAEYTGKGLDIPESCYTWSMKYKKSRLEDIGCDTKVQTFFADRHTNGTILFTLFIFVQVVSAGIGARFTSRLAKVAADAVKQDNVAI